MGLDRRCRAVRRDADPLLAGELEPGRARDVEAHLAACQECARAVKGARALDRLLRSERTPAAPGRLVADVLHEIARRRRSARARSMRRLGEAAAAVAVVALAALFVPAEVRDAALEVLAASAASLSSAPNALPEDVDLPVPDSFPDRDALAERAAGALSMLRLDRTALGARLAALPDVLSHEMRSAGVAAPSLSASAMVALLLVAPILFLLDVFLLRPRPARGRRAGAARG